MKIKRLTLAVCLLIISATLLGTASYAWFSMNTEVGVDGIQVEAYSDSLFLEISKDNTTYNTSVDFSSTGEVVLRLAKHGFVGNTFNLDIDAAIGRYNKTLESKSYYKLIAETSDSLQKYVKAEKNVDYKLGTSLVGLYEDLQFVQVTANGAKAAASTDYYKLEKGKYVLVTVTEGVTAVKGYYTLTGTPAAIATESYYEGGATQYYLKDGDAYTNITSTLELGTDLSVFYEIVANPIASTSVTGDVYLGNTGEAIDEYAYLGNYGSTGVDISDALYFGRAYSDVIANGDQKDTLNIIKKTEAKNTYFYKETVYLRNALNTNDSKNLTAAITVGGVENEISDALRVLLVVTDATTGDRVNTVYYDNVDRESVYGEGANIVGVLLGNQQETLKVDIYVYFDGTDIVSQNSPDVANDVAGVPAGVLNGQTVAIEFNIDGHNYNEPVTP